MGSSLAGALPRAAVHAEALRPSRSTCLLQAGLRPRAPLPPPSTPWGARERRSKGLPAPGRGTGRLPLPGAGHTQPPADSRGGRGGSARAPAQQREPSVGTGEPVSHAGRGGHPARRHGEAAAAHSATGHWGRNGPPALCSTRNRPAVPSLVIPLFVVYSLRSFTHSYSSIRPPPIRPPPWGTPVCGLRRELVVWMVQT